MDFKSKDQYRVHNYSIVCLGDPILCKSVQLVMATNVAKGSFHFLWTKTHFPFFECHKWVFVKQPPSITLIIGSTQSQKIIDHFLCIFHLLV
jgi:hypothetical protein